MLVMMVEARLAALNESDSLLSASGDDGGSRSRQGGRRSESRAQPGLLRPACRGETHSAPVPTRLIRLAVASPSPPPIIDSSCMKEV